MHKPQTGPHFSVLAHSHSSTPIPVTFFSFCSPLSKPNNQKRTSYTQNRRQGGTHDNDSGTVTNVLGTTNGALACVHYQRTPDWARCLRVSVGLEHRSIAAGDHHCCDGMLERLTCLLLSSFVSGALGLWVRRNSGRQRSKVVLALSAIGPRPLVVWADLQGHASSHRLGTDGPSSLRLSALA
jgi:hypothetical protein